MDIKQYTFKTELHAHTNPSSPCSDFTPAEVIQRYAKLGFDSIVVSNHFYPGMRFLDNKEKCVNAFLEDFDEATVLGKEYGINVVFGCELRFTENYNDYLIFGIDRDFAGLAYDSMGLGLENFSKNFRNDHTLIIQAHPYRDGMSHTPPELIDGIEVFNMHPGHNSRIALAAKYAQENSLLVTCGSDFHHEGHQGMAALLTKSEMKTSHDIAKVIKSRDYLIEISGCIVFPYGNV